jgi:WD40 repeat protein
MGRVILTSNNDARVRVFDASTMAPRAQLRFAWPVNYAVLQPGGSLAAVVGDDPDTSLADLSSGLTVMTLKGHRDFSFAAAWHPGGHLLATGNQVRGLPAPGGAPEPRHRDGGAGLGARRAGRAWTVALTSAVRPRSQALDG